MMERFLNNKFAKQAEGSGHGLNAVLSSHLRRGRLLENTINLRTANVPVN
jgi:hypothetical protein